MDNQLKPIEDLVTLLIKHLQDKEKSKEFNFGPKLFMACYNIITDLSSPSTSIGPNIFEFYLSVMKDYIKLYISKNLQDLQEEEFFDMLIFEWENFKVLLYVMSRIFTPLQKFYLNNLHKSLISDPFALLRTELFEKINDKINKNAIMFIEREREDEIIPSTKLFTVISYYIQLGMEKNISLEKIGDNLSYKGNIAPQGNTINNSLDFYKKNFEKFLIQTTNEFYVKKTQIWRNQQTPEYVALAHTTLKREEDRAQSYFEKSKGDYIKEIERNIITDMADCITKNESSGVIVMLKSDKRKELDDLFKLFSRVDENYKHISEKFFKYIKEKGEEFLNDPKLKKNPLEMTKTFLDFKAKMDSYSEEIFLKKLIFQNAENNAFKIFLNSFPQTPLFIAIFCDNELRKGMKGNSDDEVDKKISSIISLFSYLYSRDAFFQQYEKYLARRLLSNSSISDEYENKMINQLKVECGQSTIQKIVLMRKDMHLSKDYQEDFKNYFEKYKNSRSLTYEMSVQTLTIGCWPQSISEDDQTTIPEELRKGADVFEMFYQSKFQNRFLKWLLCQGTSEMYGTFGGKKYTFVVSNYQLALLLLFNKVKEDLTLKKIHELTQISEIELDLHLQALINISILMCRDRKSKEKLVAEDVIIVNTSFANASRRLQCTPMGKINTVISKTNSEKEEDELRKMRENQLDAAIVRVMKARKQLNYNELIDEVLRLVNTFNPQPKLIKARLESLTEREYIKRDDNDK